MHKVNHQYLVKTPNESRSGTMCYHQAKYILDWLPICIDMHLIRPLKPHTVSNSTVPILQYRLVAELPAAPPPVYNVLGIPLLSRNNVRSYDCV